MPDWSLNEGRCRAKQSRSLNGNIRPRAQELFTRAQSSIAGGVSSAFRADVKPEPLFVDHAHGARMVDVDGATYLDFALAWGPLILGHSHPRVMEAVRSQLDRGHMFGAQHEAEIRVAERIKAVVPCADLITYSNSGTEAIQVALRLARACTGRPKILKFEGHYHGWSDGALVSYHPVLTQAGPPRAPVPVPGTNGQSPGALSDVVVVPWNDPAALAHTLEEYRGSVAGIVMEPVLYNSGVIAPVPGYLETARKLADDHGALLVFDEVITGFRLALGGAQEFYGVVPDIAVYAKAIAAGFPLSVIAGRQFVMDLAARRVVQHTGTYNGNPVVLAAAEATLDELERPGVYSDLHALSIMLADGAREILRRHGVPALVHQLGPVVQILFTDQEEVLDYRAFACCNSKQSGELAEALRDRGILILPDGRWYISTVHREADISEALEVLDASMSSISPRMAMPRAPR